MLAETTEPTNLGAIIIAVVTALSAIFGALTTNQRSRIKELEREQTLSKDREAKLEKRVEHCEDDRRSLREHIVAGDAKRMDLSIQLNTALLALNNATARANAREVLNRPTAKEHPE